LATFKLPLPYLMKSAYELAMERLEKQSPAAKISEEQRRQLAEIDDAYRAKIAEREVFLQSLLKNAVIARDVDEAEKIRLQLAREVRRLEEEREAKKAKVR
jgi:hypothetical protein